MRGTMPDRLQRGNQIHSVTLARACMCSPTNNQDVIFLRDDVFLVAHELWLPQFVAAKA